MAQKVPVAYSIQLSNLLRILTLKVVSNHFATLRFFVRQEHTSIGLYILKSSNRGDLLLRVDSYWLFWPQPTVDLQQQLILLKQILCYSSTIELRKKGLSID